SIPFKICLTSSCSAFVASAFSKLSRAGSKSCAKLCERYFCLASSSATCRFLTLSKSACVRR
ncbi:hypothetical protein NT04LS_1712a, partial [Listeria seeligeri FSL S4-171]